MTGGAAAIGVAVLCFGALLAEVGRYLTGEIRPHWWHAVLLGAGVGCLVLGLGQRYAEWRQRRIAIAVSAFNPRRGSNGRVKIEQAQTFSTSSRVALSVHTDLTGDLTADAPAIQRLAEQRAEALVWAERLTSGASRVNVIPTMPLHLAFWLGAQLGHAHTWEVAVLAARSGGRGSPYFHATTLRTVDGAKLRPLEVSGPEPVLGADSTCVALGVSIPARGQGFAEPVMVACQQAGIGRVVTVQHPGRLPEDWAAFTGAVEGVCQAWRDAPLPVGARTGQHTIFLDCPVVVALALGARLAGPTPGLWTAYTFDPDSGVYEPFPPGPLASSPPSKGGLMAETVHGHHVPDLHLHPASRNTDYIDAELRNGG